MAQVKFFFLTLLLSVTFASQGFSAYPPIIWKGLDAKILASRYLITPGASIGTLSGILKATAGVVSGSATVSDLGTIGDGDLSLYNKPAVTVVATTNQALAGTPTIDGQLTAVGSLILLTAQSTGSQNGPWVAAAGAWARPTWYTSGSTTQAMQFITTFVRLGSTYQGTTWRQTAAGPITIDTTATTWAIAPLALNSSTVTGILPNANTTATASNTLSSIVLRDGSGNFSAGTITATLTGSATSFSGSLVGDVTGTQGATVVSSVGGSTAANVHSAELAANAASSSLTAGSGVIVSRTSNNNFTSPGLVSGSIVSKTANYTILAQDSLVLVSTSGGAFTLTLPNPNTYKTIKIKDIGGALGTNNLTLARFGSEQIEGSAASYVMSANFGNYEFQSDGTNWWKVSAASNHASKTFAASTTWSPQAGATIFNICGRGASGGAGGSSGGAAGSGSAAAAGGGSSSCGGAVITNCRIVTLVPLTSYTITIGAAGTGGAGSNGAAANAAGASSTTATSGNAGGTTSFGSVIAWQGGPGGGGGGGATLTTGGTGGGAPGSRVIGNSAGAAGGNPGSSGSTGGTGLIGFNGNRQVGGTGGASGASRGGGGAGASGCSGADMDATGTAAVGGAGNLASAGSDGVQGINAPANTGLGGYASSGGGGSGIGLFAGGNGKVGGDGDAGIITLSWVE